jgi:hypothetical protein
VHPTFGSTLPRLKFTRKSGDFLRASYLLHVPKLGYVRDRLHTNYLCIFILILIHDLSASMPLFLGLHTGPHAMSGPGSGLKSTVRRIRSFLQGVRHPRSPGLRVAGLGRFSGQMLADSIVRVLHCKGRRVADLLMNLSVIILNSMPPNIKLLGLVLALFAFGPPKRSESRPKKIQK